MDGTCSHDCFDCTGKDELFDGQWYRCWAGQVWWVLLCYSSIYTMDICLRTIVYDIGGLNLVNSTLLLHHHLDGWISRSILRLTLFTIVDTLRKICWVATEIFFFFFLCVSNKLYMHLWPVKWKTNFFLGIDLLPVNAYYCFCVHYTWEL